MATLRYSAKHGRTGRRGLSIIECGLALSVIVGLGFVSLRIMSMGLPASWTKTADTAALQLNSETTPPAPDTPDTKTP